MPTHQYLRELGKETILIHQRNQQKKSSQFDKGASGQDVVTGTDLMNEKELRTLLKRRVSGLFFIYGEEEGYEVIGDGEMGALIDPIDGTRAYVMDLFYSSISIAFVNQSGEVLAGYIVTINNQEERAYHIWTYDGFSVQKDGQYYSPKPFRGEIRQAMISITNVSNFPERDRELAGELFKLAADRTRGSISICSGAVEILLVVEGKLQGYINVTRRDMVSHPVAIAIAKQLGFFVGHVHTEGQDFRVPIDRETWLIQPKEDWSVVVTTPGMEREILEMIQEAKQRRNESENK